MWSYNDIVFLLEQEHQDDSIDEMVKGDLKVTLPRQRTAHRSFPALDYDTLVEHLERHSYNPVKSPGGSTRDVSGIKEGMSFRISVHDKNYPEEHDLKDIVQLEFSANMDRYDNPEHVFQKVTEDVVVELLNRERKLNRAVDHYVHEILKEQDDPNEMLETELGFYGDTVDTVAEKYFEGSRRSELFNAYASEFEIGSEQSVMNRRSEMPGLMPLADALKNEDLKQRNKSYLKRFVGEVIESAVQEFGETETLTDYIMSYRD